jgi:Transglycosylase SLT domain
VTPSARRAALLALSLVWPEIAGGAPAEQPEPAAPQQSGTVSETVCSLVEQAARVNHIPVALLTRLIWTESRFRADATSPKGAQGIAQFMPGTAAQRGLVDPFDPEQAIPKAAKLLVDLTRRFGNVGLAAAAYNAGANRVADWLAGSGSLPRATQLYVVSLTGTSAEDWKRDRQQAASTIEPGPEERCSAVTAELRSGHGAGETAAAPLAPWGVQLSGNFSKDIALASFERAEQRYRTVLGDVRPMILGGVLHSRGWRPFYRIMIPEASRADADRTCQAIMTVGGACVALRT